MNCFCVRLFEKLTLLLMVLTPLAKANTVELVGQVGVGRFIDGVNLTANNLFASLSSEWSAHNGAFVSLSCFGRENNLDVAIQRGCDAELGWFKPINDQHAFTVTISRHDYSSPKLSGWEYTDARFRWHLGKQNSIGLRASDSLLGQGFSSTTAFFESSKKLTDRLGVGLEAGYTVLESNPKARSLAYAVLGSEYGFKRFSVGVKLLISDSNYKRYVALDVKQPELAVDISYRFY